MITWQALTTIAAFFVVFWQGLYKGLLLTALILPAANRTIGNFGEMLNALDSGQLRLAASRDDFVMLVRTALLQKVASRRRPFLRS